MKTILAAIDFSEITDRVVSTAAELARAMGAEVVLVSVVQPPLATEYVPYVDNIAEIEHAAETSANRRLDVFRQRLIDERIAVETVQSKGAPISQIVQAAKERQADYLVMGSHGHAAFYDLLVGSTTHGVLLRAPCPVVIVPPQAGRHQAGSGRQSGELAGV